MTNQHLPTAKHLQMWFHLGKTLCPGSGAGSSLWPETASIHRYTPHEASCLSRILQAKKMQSKPMPFWQQQSALASQHPVDGPAQRRFYQTRGGQKLLRWWTIWGGSTTGGTPDGWFVTENPIKIHDLGVPPFQEPPIYSKVPGKLRSWLHQKNPQIGAEP